MDLSKMYSPLKIGIVHCYASLPEGKVQGQTFDAKVLQLIIELPPRAFEIHHAGKIFVESYFVVWKLSWFLYFT